MHEKDTVATALENILEGEEAGIFDSENKYLYSISAAQRIPFGNKIALVDTKKSDKVIKYGGVIGECTVPFHKGDLVHVHNVKSLKIDIPPAFKKEIMRQMNILSGDV
jgi:hypothetical protein